MIASDSADAIRFVAEAALTPAELNATEAYQAARVRAAAGPNSALLETALGFAVALGGAGMLVVAGVVRQANGFWVATGLMIAYVVGLLVMVLAIRRYYRRVQGLRRAGAPLPAEARVFSIDDAGILVRGASADAFWRWRAFTDVVREGDLILLWTGLSHGFAIPARAFQTLQEADAAVTFAQARIRRDTPA